MTSSKCSMKPFKDPLLQTTLSRKRKAPEHGPQSSACSDESFDHSNEPAFDWIEEEMAKVCGEGSEDGSSLKQSHLPVLELPKPSFSSTCSQVVKFSPNNVKPMLSNTELLSKAFTSKSKWHSLCVKNEADLKRKLKRVEELGGTEKRAKIEKRFLELFGPDEPTTNPVGKNPEKKEDVAALTVKYLMPMYKSQKIASRELFKKLAKHISHHLLEKLQSPSECDVRSRVQELFSNGKSICTEADIYA